jgi:hypothetical protein
MKLKVLGSKKSDSNKTSIAKSVADKIKQKGTTEVSGSEASAISSTSEGTTMLDRDKRAQNEWYEKNKASSNTESPGQVPITIIGRLKKQKRGPSGMESGSSDTSSSEDKSNIKVKVGGRIIGGK